MFVPGTVCEALPCSVCPADRFPETLKTPQTHRATCCLYSWQFPLLPFLSLLLLSEMACSRVSLKLLQWVPEPAEDLNCSNHPCGGGRPMWATESSGLLVCPGDDVLRAIRQTPTAQQSQAESASHRCLHLRGLSCWGSEMGTDLYSQHWEGAGDTLQRPPRASPRAGAMQGAFAFRSFLARTYALFEFHLEGRYGDGVCASDSMRSPTKQVGSSLRTT